MLDILILLISTITIIICSRYVIAESLRRKKLKGDAKMLEANIDIRTSLVGIIIGLSFYLTFATIFYASSTRELNLLIIGQSIVIFFNLISYLLARIKVIIIKSNGEVTTYKIFKKKKFNVKIITLIKHGHISWTAYSGQTKCFYISDRHFNYPIEFYNFIREESECEETHPKGHTSRKYK